MTIKTKPHCKDCWGELEKKNLADALVVYSELNFAWDRYMPRKVWLCDAHMQIWQRETDIVKEGSLRVLKWA